LDIGWTPPRVPGKEVDMSDKKVTRTVKTAKKEDAPIKDLTPRRDPKGGELNTTIQPDRLPRGGWDGNHNLA
jgi:hypothetical protein